MKALIDKILARFDLCIVTCSNSATGNTIGYGLVRLSKL